MEMLLNNIELVNTLATVTMNDVCGDIPQPVFAVVGAIVMLIQVVVPILLIIWGMLDFAKAVIGGDEDKIKAGQKTFIKRLIAAVILFLVVTVVKLLLNLVGTLTDDPGTNGASKVDTDNIWKCVNGFLAGQKPSK